LALTSPLVVSIHPAQFNTSAVLTPPKLFCTPQTVPSNTFTQTIALLWSATGGPSFPLPSLTVIKTFVISLTSEAPPLLLKIQNSFSVDHEAASTVPQFHVEVGPGLGVAFGSHQIGCGAAI
jgi:hypothetical protein